MLMIAAVVSIGSTIAAAIAGAPADSGVHQAVAPDSGVVDMLLRLVGRFIDKAGDVLTHPNVLWSVFAVVAGAVLGVIVTEALKRFAPLLPRIFEGEHWKLKVMALAAIVGGAIAFALTAVATDGTRAAVAVYSVVAMIAAAGATPTLYELAYKVAPNLTDRLLKRVRGEA
jgi:hypothetical protein